MLLSAQVSLYESQYSGINTSNFSMLDNNGELLSIGININNLLVLKTNPIDGEVQDSLSFTFSDADSVNLSNSIVTANGDYCFLVSKYIGLNEEAIVMRTDSDGNVLFSKRYYLDLSATYNVIKEDEFGDLIIGGNVVELNYYLHPILFKIDANGNLLWYKRYATIYYGIEDFEILSDGSMVAVGYNNNEAWFINVSILGVQTSLKYISLNGTVKVKFIRKINNGFAISGEIAGGGSNGSFDYFIAELDESLNLQWSKAIGGLFREEVKYFEPYNSDSYLLYGISRSENNINYQAELMRVSNNGSILWARVFGGDQEDDSSGGLVLANNNDILVNLNHNSSAEEGMKIIRTNQFGDISCGERSGTLNDLTMNLIEQNNLIFLPETDYTGEQVSVPLTGLFTNEKVELCSSTSIEQEKFQKVLVAPDLDQVRSIVETYDGGYVVVGHTNNGIHGNSDMLCMRLDKKGDTLWTSFFGTTGFESGQDVLLEPDGGFLILNKNTLQIVKISAEGMVISSKKFSDSQGGKMIRSKFDNSIIVATDLGVFKINSDLTREWGYTYFSNTTFNDIMELPSGDIVAVGANFDGPLPVGLVFKLDSLGSEIFSNHIELLGGSTLLTGIDSMSNGDLVLSGVASESGESFPFLTRLDENGAQIWTRKYPNSVQGGFNDLIIKNDLIYAVGYVFATLIEPEAGNSLLMRVNGDGTVDWAKSYGKHFDDSRLNSISNSYDNGFILGGYTSAFGNGGWDFYIIKTDSLGNSGDCHEFDRTISSEVFGLNNFSVANTQLADINESITTIFKGYWNILYRDLNIELESIATDVSCNGANDGNISISPNSGIGPFAYSWDNTETGDMISDLGPGDYEVTVEDNAGCVSSKIVTIEEPSPIVSTFTTIEPSCFGNGDGEAIVHILGGVEPYNYFWSNGQTDSIALGLLSANHSVNVFDANNCLHSNLLFLDQPEKVSIDFIANNATCGSADGSIMASASGGDNNFTYTWSTGAIGNDVDEIESGSYSVTAEDGNGCQLTELYDLGSQVTPVEIWLITVDTTSSKNVIVWEKEITGNIDGYNVYRNVLGAYQNIGFVPYADLSEFTDNSFGVDPNITSYRYKISKVDTCGNESELSSFHETMHLTTNLGTNDNINLIWDEYEGFGFVSYRILKDTTDNNINDYFEIDAVGSGVFTWTDQDPESFVNYTVVVDPSGTCSSTKANDYNSSRSNRAGGIANPNDVGIEEFSENDFSVYPNPNNGNFVVKSNNAAIDAFEIMDAFGKVILSRSMNFSLEEVQLNVQAGIYFVRLKSKTHSSIKRITIR